MAEDPFDAAAGRHLRRNLLAVGLSVEPRRMIGNLLGETAVVACAGGGFCPVPAELLAEIGA